jgi:aspartyl-tRNA(Asn)/glutamyl-tRNA(Gln) amidotransferase subunit A
MLSRRNFVAVVMGARYGSASAPQDLDWINLVDAAAMLRRRTVSPVDLTQSCIRRVERLNPRLNAFITVTAETAIAEARLAEKEILAGRWRGPLHGIPIALKDLFDTAGLRTTAASAQYSERFPAEDAEVVRRLRAAGAVILGKLNMDEFAYGFTSETSCYGLSRNPWDAQRSPGGSSGGSAIAVATGMCFAALGSDTGGSIRLPAAFCGITGLKPTYGRVATRGVVPLAWSLDHVGPMCRSARDAATVLAAICGRDRVDPACSLAAVPPLNDILRVPAKTLRLGVPKGAWFQKSDPEIKDASENAVKLLERLCRTVEEVDLPLLPPAPQLPALPLTYLLIIQSEAYAFHEELLKRHPERYHASTRNSIQNGEKIAVGDYVRARREMERLRAEIGSVFDRVDLLITPTSPGAAFELGKTPDVAFLGNTAPWNLYGLPSISVPCGFTAGGLPIGLQITGPAAREDLVLKLADAYQQSTDWHRRRPPATRS